MRFQCQHMALFLEIKIETPAHLGSIYGIQEAMYGLVDVAGGNEQRTNITLETLRKVQSATLVTDTQCLSLT
jgi:hypothetical protein